MEQMLACEFLSYSEDETIEFSKTLAKKISSTKVIAFFGDLGAGKTTFIRGLVEGLNSKDSVTSPTFTYMQIYDSEVPIYHFDLYRIKDLNEFMDLGFFEYFEKNGICLIEWSERIKSILPKNTLTVEILHLDKQQRKIIIKEL